VLTSQPPDDASLFETAVWLYADPTRRLDSEEAGALLENWLDQGAMDGDSTHHQAYAFLCLLVERGLDLNRPLPRSGLMPLVKAIREPGLKIHPVSGENDDYSIVFLLFNAGARLWEWADASCTHRVIDEPALSRHGDLVEWLRSRHVQQRLVREKLLEASGGERDAAPSKLRL
jgi:hypothetical protein